MSSVYTDVVFTTQQPDLVTAKKLNMLRDDLSTAIASIGGYYTDTWKWAGISPPPSSGYVTIDATNWASATTLYINETDAAGVDKSVVMDKVNASGNTILVKDAANANNYGEYTITAAGTDMGTYRQYPISVVASSGILPKNNANTTLTVYVQGATGGGGGTGDMTKAVYDVNNNGKVDTCDSLAWTAVTGKPSTFPPDSTAMLKSVYDTNADNIVDHAALADTAPWAGITGRPSTFPPDSTAMLKSVYDVNANNKVDSAENADAVPWTGVTGKPTTFPPDSTAMLKSVYDANSDNIVDHAALSDTAPWTGITGKPSTFPPDSTAMLKSVYDTNANNKVDGAESADTAPWTGISGKPATFSPSAHAATHLDNGSDPVPVVTTLRTGLAPTLSGTTTTFLRGDGTWQVPAGAGDMTKAVYDVNGDNIVDKAAALSTAGSANQFWKNGNVWGQPAWTDLSGIPTAVSTLDPGTWTALSYGTGWSQTTAANYRVETVGTIKTVIGQGIIAYASGAASLAFTLPVGARPAVIRGCVLAGYDSTNDTQLFQATISTAGVVNIVPMVRQSFVWASATNGSVYLDNLNFSL